MEQSRTGRTESGITNPGIFLPHPNLDDEINRNICQSEVEGGVFLDNLPIGAVLKVETENRFYFIENRGNGQVLIDGHPKFCPQPVLVYLHGSTWRNSMLKMHFIGRGMYMEFRHPTFGIIITSCVQNIGQVTPDSDSPGPRYEHAC